MLSIIALAMLGGEYTILPLRDGTARGSMREAQLAGEPRIPRARAFGTDGLPEVWAAVPGLPLPVMPGPDRGPANLLEGAASPDPADLRSLMWEAVIGIGPTLRLPAAGRPPIPDTPRAEVAFHRGALGFWRFGTRLERRLGRIADLRLTMRSRNEASRSWSYRTQVNQIFVGAGRTIEDLPTQGQSPGLESTRWTLALGRGDDRTVRWDLEGGKGSTRRGLPSATSDSLGSGVETWKDLLARVGGRMADGQVSAEGWAREGRIVLARAGGDTSSWNGTSSGVNLRLSQEVGSWEGRLRMEGLMVVGTVGGEVVSGEVEVIQGLAAARLRRGDSATGWSVEAGVLPWTADGYGLGGFGEIKGDVGSRWGSGRVRLRSRSLLPDPAATRLPDPLGLRAARRADSAGREDLLDVIGRLGSSTEGGRLTVGYVVLSRHGSLVPAHWTSHTDPPRETMPREPVRGMALEGGLGWSGKHTVADLRGTLARTGRPGSGWNGALDPREPSWSLRLVVRKRGALVQGRMRIESTLEGLLEDGVRIPAPSTGGGTEWRSLAGTARFDLENRFEIESFGLFWRLENLGHVREEPSPGWTPPGVRSSWGVTWVFDG